MSDPVMMALIAAVVGIAAGLPALLVAVATFWQAVKTHKAVNSKMDQLLETTGASEHAKGVIQGRAAAKAKLATPSTPRPAPVRKAGAATATGGQKGSDRRVSGA